jgi:hypothetical protein
VRARRWAAGTPAAAIKAGGLGGAPVSGTRRGGAAVWGGTVEFSTHWREGEEARGGGSTPGLGRPARPGRWSGRLRVEDGPDR